jgi:hypothetical protein
MSVLRFPIIQFSVKTFFNLMYMCRDGEVYLFFFAFVFIDLLSLACLESL